MAPTAAAEELFVDSERTERKSSRFESPTSRVEGITQTSVFSEEDKDPESVCLPLEGSVCSISPIPSILVDYDSDNEEEKEEDESEELDEEFEDIDEEQAELVVLDPDHPLMKRFQTALKTHLLKQADKLTLEVRELDWDMKKQTTEREDTGVILYGVQQNLAQRQMELEKNHNRFSQISTKRRQTEEYLGNVRKLYQQRQAKMNSERLKVSQLQTDVENLAMRLYYMESLKQDVQSDIMVMKRAAEKLDSEKAQAAKLKQKQDMFVDRLVSQMDRLREQIALYEAQCTAQREETKAARGTVGEAVMEIEAIDLEKKQLLHHWRSSLMGMQQRDETYSAMQDAASESKHQSETLRTEIEAYKNFITKEEEKNELLTVVLNRLVNDINMTKKLMAQNMAKQEGIKNEYTTYTRTLQETERLINKATMERSLEQGELNMLRVQIERQHRSNNELEDNIMEKLQNQMILSQATNHFKRLFDAVRIQKRQLVVDYAKMENDYAQTTLEINYVKSRLSMLQVTLDKQDKELAERNHVIQCSEKEITKRILIVQNKQSVLNIFNKKIAQLLAERGGEEISPLELEIRTLSKQIDEHNEEIILLQQYWLRQQNELIKLAREREEQTVAVELLKKQSTILQQKKIRTENEIQQEENEKKDIEHHMRNLSNDMQKLNMLLTKNSSMKESLQHTNILMENDFLNKLKDAERESIVTQQKLDHLKEDKERLLNSLVEAERQIMLWERKIQLGKEARSAVDSNIGQSEVRSMRAEIHRMQVRHTQLMKQQERMIREMEAIVTRRDTILTRGEAQAKMDKTKITRNDYHNKIQEACKKIAAAQKNIEESDKTIEELRERQRLICGEMREKQCQIQENQTVTHIINADIDNLEEKKRTNFCQIVTLQTRAKHLQAVKEGKYKPQWKTEESLKNEMQKQENQMHAFSSTIDFLLQQRPHYQPALRKVTLAIASWKAAAKEKL
ncbi:coiled-coil domain-containing protein 40 [Callorhinchus milii]|nr:coiled-coil domain-containing protein 40 [Callorhinchus milii]